MNLKDYYLSQRFHKSPESRLQAARDESSMGFNVTWKKVFLVVVKLETGLQAANDKSSMGPSLQTSIS